MGSKKSFDDTLVSAVPPPAEPLHPDLTEAFPASPPPQEPSPPVPEAPKESRQGEVNVSGRFVGDETVARIVDLCRDCVRTDPGGVGQLGARILADLGV